MKKVRCLKEHEKRSDKQAVAQIASIITFFIPHHPQRKNAENGTHKNKVGHSRNISVYELTRKCRKKILFAALLVLVHWNKLVKIRHPHRSNTEIRQIRDQYGSTNASGIFQLLRM